MSSSFTEEQAAAVNAGIDHPIAIVACPGSGKTYTIIHRVAKLIKNGINESQMLIITFTRKAAQELRQRLGGMGLDVKKLTVATFHSFGRIVLRRYGHLVGLKDFRLITENEQFGILQKYLPNGDGDKKEIMLRLQVYKGSNTCEDNSLKTAFDKYNAELKAGNLCDFTDLILKPIEIFRHNPSALEYYQRRYQYCLVDEMQDVSMAQFDLIHILFEKTGRVTVVGDDDQTIYGWRGADASLLLNFSKKFTNAETLTLSTCFRCPNFVIKAMSKVIQNNKVRVKKVIKSTNSESIIYSNQKILLIGALTRESEARLVADEIEKTVKKPGTVAVLYRTRTAANDLAAELKTRKVSITKSDNSKRLDGKSAQILLNALLYIAGSNYDSKVLNPDLLSNIARGIEKIKTTPENDDVIRSELSTVTIKEAIDRIADALDLHDPSVNVLISEAGDRTDFVTFVDDVKEMPLSQDDKGSGRVTMTTAHQAKGLEWDHVFIIGANKGQWPSNRRGDIEEERRLFYVAMSRARQSLCVSCSQKPGPSPFVIEIPEYLVNERIERELVEDTVEVTHSKEASPEKKKEKKKNVSYPGFVSVSAIGKLNIDSQPQAAFVKPKVPLGIAHEIDSQEPPKLPSFGPPPGIKTGVGTLALGISGKPAEFKPPRVANPNKSLPIVTRPVPRPMRPPGAAFIPPRKIDQKDGSENK